jgi:hypothetical protein
MLFETVENERALDLFAQTAADRGDNGENQRLRGRLNQLLKGVLFHVVQRGEEQACRRQDDHGKSEHDDRQAEADPHFAADRQRPEEDVAWLFAVPSQQPEDERNEHRCVDEQQRGDVAKRQLAAVEGCEAGEGEERRERELRRNARAQRNLEEREGAGGGDFAR